MDASNKGKCVDKKEQHSASKCRLCSKVFHSRYVRDFHMIHVHGMDIPHTCYKCVDNPDADESDTVSYTHLTLPTNREV